MKLDTWNKRKWLSESPRIGTYTQSTDSSVTEVLGQVGFSFVVIDLEHGPLDRVHMKQHIQAAETVDIVSIVRISDNHQQQIMSPLDSGALGIQVPNVNDPEQARRAQKACRYYPQGNRGSNPYVRSNAYGSGDFQKSMESCNEQLLLIIQVEGIRGVENLPKIMPIRGIDVIWVGPYDLSQSMGLPGQISHPKVIKKITEIVNACRQYGIVVGTFADNAKTAKRWIEAGVSLIAISYDMQLLYDGAGSVIKEFHS